MTAPIDPLLEALADAEHESWSRWMFYLFGVSEQHADGAVTIPARFAERWKRQAGTRYADLPEVEKESDRDEVRRILPLIKADRGRIPSKPLRDVLGGPAG